MASRVKAAKFTAKARKLLNSVTQLNESLYELHRPQGLPTVQVIFFHGFQRDYKDPHLFTWTARDDSGLWPQTWLVDKFPNAHILAVSYFGGKLHEILKEFGKGVEVDMYIVVENLISDLLDAKIGQEPRCPVVLIGHSFGGLVVKQICVKAFHLLGAGGTLEDRKTTQVQYFVDNLKGVFFYATPHRGIQENSIEFVEPVLLRPTGPLVEYMKILGKETARLNHDFDHVLGQRKDWRIAGLGEQLPTKLDGFEGLIVPEGSSRYSADFNIAEGKDHISISRPESHTSRSFTALQRLLESIELDPQFGRPENWQWLPKRIIGIKHALGELKQKLKTSNKLALLGMGGIGKTTLAMALFNDLERGYQYTCFISDVKNLQGLQDVKVSNAMLERLHYGGQQNTCKDSMSKLLAGKRLLLVLDDIGSGKDLEIIGRVVEGVGVHGDSRFIVTTRDPRRLDLRSDEVYRVPFLSPESSKKLFLDYGFPSDIKPDDNYERFPKIIIGKCGNLPLTLEVVGKHLLGKNEVIWEEAARVLDKATGGFEEELWGILRLSYDGLDSQGKGLFLDACTVFYGEELNVAMSAWSITTQGEPATIWQRLMDLSLVWEVKEGQKVTISMHDQLLSLGRRIASTPPEIGRRIWDDDNKALKLLSEGNEDMDDLKDIIALKCSWTRLEGLNGSGAQGTTAAPGNFISVSGRKLQNMRKLQYLWLEGVGIDQTQDWNVASLLSFFFRENVQFPPTIVYLHFSGVNFSGLTFSRHKHYNSMAVLKILGCSGLRKLPDALKLPRGLKYIELQDTSLKSVPDFGKLRSLESLRLSWVPASQFPSLPECLKEEVTKRYFPGPFNLKVEHGKFTRDYKAIQVNQSLYELYRPEGETTPIMQVLFFHGLQHHDDYKYAHLSTWTSRDSSSLWPQTWLAERFPDAQIFSVEYYSMMESKNPTHRVTGATWLYRILLQSKYPRNGLNIFTVAEDLLADVLHANIGQKAGCPVVLVGHSLGGLW